MSTSQLERPSDDTETVELEFHDRMWPATKEEPDTSLNTQPVRELSDRDIEPDLATIVAADLVSRLRIEPIENATDAAGEEIVAAYVASLERLQQIRSDAEFLIEAVCLSHIEFEQVSGSTDQPKRDAAEKKLLEGMLERANLRLPVAGNIATADLLAGPTDELRQTLGQHLRQSVTNFTSELFELFNRLVDEQLAGLFEWSGTGTCWYHFFREIVRQENGGTTTRHDSRIVTGLDSSGEEIQIRRASITSTTTGKDTIRLARHEHHVMNAYQTSLENSKVVMPLAVQEMVATIPSWLVPYISVIDGTLFRERIIHRDYRTDDWGQVRVSTVDQPVLDFEPAVLIGNVVLAGWGPTEIAKELERRAKVSHEEQHLAGQKAELQPAVAAYVSPLFHMVAILLLVLAFTVSPAWMLFSLFCSVAGVWTGIVSRSESQRIASEKHTPVRNTLQSLGTLMASAAVQCLLTSALRMDGWLVVSSIVCFITAGVLHSTLSD